MSADPTNDTNPKIEAFLIEGYRKMSPSQKLERVKALTRTVQEFNAAGRYVDATLMRMNGSRRCALPRAGSNRT